jgi:predicted glycosyltransferase
MLIAMKKEQKLIDQLIEKQNIKGIISDNRFGAYSPKVSCVYMTHQVEVRSGIWTWITTALHRRIMRKYDICWIPDRPKVGLSGRLGHPKNPIRPHRHIGVLSRLKPKNIEKKYDILILLSGPEPQRTLLQRKILDVLSDSDMNIAMVRGTTKKCTMTRLPGNLTSFDLLLTRDLEAVIAASDLVIARSGYSTIMDLASMRKKAFFIPTPGQAEQKYLAEHMHSLGIAPYCKQHKFVPKELERIRNYTGFTESIPSLDLNLFELFKGKGKS